MNQNTYGVNFELLMTTTGQKLLQNMIYLEVQPTM